MEIIIDELFQSSFSKYQIRLEISIKGSDFIFDYIDSLFYKCHEIILKRGGLNIDSLDRIKKQKSHKKP